MALNETQKAVLAAIKAGQRTRVNSDTYAASRCACGHLVYANQAHGGSCLFCACDDHRAPAAAGPPAAKGRQ